MLWTYTGDPGDSPKDAVRFLLGDTDPDDKQLSDPEINFMLSRWGGNIYKAAAEAARTIGGRYARQTDKQVGDLRLNFSQRSEKYFAIAAELERTAYKRVAPFAGGISKSQKQTQEKDDDRVKPAFRRGMMENQNSSDDGSKFKK